MPFSKNLELNMFQLHYMVRSMKSRREKSSQTIWIDRMKNEIRDRSLKFIQNSVPIYSDLDTPTNPWDWSFAPYTEYYPTWKCLSFPVYKVFSCVLLLLVGITLLPFHDLMSIVSNGQELPVKVIDTHKVV